MWIRSQDRDTLIDAHSIYLKGTREGFCIFADGKFLGAYSTKEKALKVIDQIDDCLTAKAVYLVFTMPQDETNDA